MDTRKIRELFPVTRNSVYLNNAAGSPLNARVQSRMESYLRLVGETPDAKPGARGPVKGALSRTFGGDPGDYALLTSTGIGVGIVAAGYDWKTGDNVVVPADEHWNNTFPWLALRRRGVEVRLVPVGKDQRVDPEVIASMVDANTRILATAAVRFDTGFRADLKMLSGIAHDSGAMLLVDGIQGAGVFPIDMHEMGIDILACAGFKWLLGPTGTGFLYINQQARQKIHPVLPGMFAAQNSFQELVYHPDARRYETGTIAYSLFYAWVAGLELLEEVGVQNIHDRVLGLTDMIIAGLRSREISIISPVEKTSERSAIIAFTMDSDTKNRALHEKLTANNILVALRPGSIRVSPNLFNTEEEIEQFLVMLA